MPAGPPMNPMLMQALQAAAAQHAPGAPMPGRPGPGGPMPPMGGPGPGGPPGMPPGMPGPGPMPGPPMGGGMAGPIPPGMPPQQLDPNVMRGMTDQQDSLLEQADNILQTYLHFAAQTNSMNEKTMAVADTQQRLTRIRAGATSFANGSVHGTTSLPEMPPPGPGHEGGPPMDVNGMHSMGGDSGMGDVL